MKRTNWIVYLIVACFFAATRLATASILTFTQFCPQSNISFPGNKACSMSSQGGSTTRVMANPDGGKDQIFSASASAMATLDTWKLNAALSVRDYRRDNYVWQDSVDGSSSVSAMVASFASLTDTLTVLGGSGVYSLSYIFSLDGSLSSSDLSLISSEMFAGLDIPEGTGTFAHYVVDAGNTVPAMFTLTYADLPFGEPVNPTLFMGVDAMVLPIYESEIPSLGAKTITGTASSEFGSTIHLTSVLVTDGNGKPIPGVTLQSSAGYQYPLDSSNSIPEPAWLTPIGLIVLALYRKLRS